MKRYLGLLYYSRFSLFSLSFSLSLSLSLPLLFFFVSHVQASVSILFYVHRCFPSICLFLSFFSPASVTARCSSKREDVTMFFNLINAPPLPVVSRSRCFSSRHTLRTIIASHKGISGRVDTFLSLSLSVFFSPSRRDTSPICVPTTGAIKTSACRSSLFDAFLHRGSLFSRCLGPLKTTGPARLF